MRSPDETDLAILRLLLEDARRPYNDIATQVDVSAPTVSDRVNRMSELDIIERFTIDLDQSCFTDGVDLLIDLELRATSVDGLTEALVAVDGIEHVFTTTDARVLAIGSLRSERVGPALLEALDAEQIESYRVHLLQARARDPSITAGPLTLNCDTCADTVGEDGVTVSLDDTLHHFCDESCQKLFEERNLTAPSS
ncbi:AsnC family transcriptional regulator [Halovivax gelatinilyticus]|uniref:AsnC family transcriptional regulator n=1 Tax=Halovivax gelatinilyticus TaxID=2961597 RepID=UPI0020CA2F50|nr:AsnC family transcriptional regulator [Halovivax gelatinilyticus]